MEYTRDGVIGLVSQYREHFNENCNEIFNRHFTCQQHLMERKVTTLEIHPKSEEIMSFYPILLCIRRLL